MLRRLLGDRDFRLLYAGQSLTMFGDVALFLVLAIWVKDLTGSNGAAGSVFLFFILPSLAGPILAVVVDRYPRRHVMIANDLVTGVGILTLLLVQDHDDVWLIYAVAAFYGLSQQIFFAARSGLLAGWLESEALGDANGLLESTRMGLRVVGPPAGALLYGLFGGGATAMLDAATFFASAAFLWMLRVPDIARTERSGETFLREVSQGARHLFRTPDLRRMVLVFVIALCVVGLLEPAIFALVDEGLHRSPEFVGVLGMVQGLGSVAGGVMAGRILRRGRELWMLGAGSLVAGLGLAPLALARLAPVFAALLVIGAGIAALNVAYFTLLQRRTANELQGRVFAASETILNAPYAASIGLGAALIGTVGFRAIYVTNAVVLSACGLYLLIARPPEAGPSTAKGEPHRRRYDTPL
jgi:predicted MFS family arabinose efflux permease